MNRAIKRAMAFKKRGRKTQSDRNAEIFEEVLARELQSLSLCQMDRTDGAQKKSDVEKGGELA